MKLKKLPNKTVILFELENSKISFTTTNKTIEIKHTPTQMSIMWIDSRWCVCMIEFKFKKETQKSIDTYLYELYKAHFYGKTTQIKLKDGESEVDIDLWHWSGNGTDIKKKTYILKGEIGFIKFGDKDSAEWDRLMGGKEMTPENIF